LIGHRLPPHYKPVLVPPVQPVKTHPIIIVRGPNGPRPPLRFGAEQVVLGKVWTPLPHVGGLAAGSAGGLSRDYPVSLGTHLAVLGKVAKEDPAVKDPQLATGWRSVSPQPVVTGSAGGVRQRPVAVEAAPAAQGRPAPLQPVRTAAPPMQAPVRPVAPVPAPAPVYHPPPPPPPPPPAAAAPAHVEPAKPK
jgi:hypothetical protein